MKDTRASPNASPILPGLDEKTIAAFPTGKPREEDHIESVICKTCKRPILKQAAVDHIRGCLKAKQEKARKKKEARDAANRAKEKVDGDDDGDSKIDGEDAMKGQKSAKKSSGVKGMAEDGTKKGKKRKVDAGGAGAGAGAGGEENDKEPKKKKKKEEPKPKAPKPKGPVDVEKQCGVTLPNGAQCARSLTCKSHSMGAKRAVPGRSLPYDMLLQAYQKKNQARQQSTSFFPSFMRCLHAFLSTACMLRHLQRLLSTPMPPFKTTWTPMAPWTRTKKKTTSWPPSAAPTPNPSSLKPSSQPKTSTATSGSKRCYPTPWAVPVAVDCFPPVTPLPRQMEAISSRPRIRRTCWIRRLRLLALIRRTMPLLIWSISHRCRRLLGRLLWLRIRDTPPHPRGYRS